ncbi:hypothetical protein QTQ03_16030 [Micromonospora sp. WMMA1363]|uniref:hypothetical protein n=1 Tax=Micromonospora sp. WMMA1363 TaxID=3053985 RepID=UPI00259C7F14|nr:hypothetical protein [Micromonospora sp. WMMA1363]MDM4721030.1 hypothetical protein [Micromonospora sp. WMMA1363]
MINPPDTRLAMAVPAVVLSVAALAVLVWLGAHAVRYLVVGKQLRPVLRVAWRIKYTWRRTAAGSAWPRPSGSARRGGPIGRRARS